MILPAKNLLNENLSGLLYENTQVAPVQKEVLEVTIPKGDCDKCGGTGMVESLSVLRECECLEVLTIDQLVQNYVMLKNDNIELERKLREVFETIQKISKGNEDECS